MDLVLDSFHGDDRGIAVCQTLRNVNYGTFLFILIWDIYCDLLILYASNFKVRIITFCAF